MPKSLIIAVLVVLALALVLGFAFRGSLGDLFSRPAPAPALPEAPQVSTYATTTYSVDYPQGYTLNESYVYEQFAGKPVHGVSLTVPASIATASTDSTGSPQASSGQAGTNLGSDTRISIEQLPRAKNCTGDIFIPANVTAHEVSDGGITYSVASTSGAAAGNFYEEIVYALPSSSPCTAVRYYIHSTNIGNYPEGMVREYDRIALVAAFDTIRRSLKTN